MKKIIAYVNNPWSQFIRKQQDLIGNTLGEGIGISTPDSIVIQDNEIF